MYIHTHPHAHAHTDTHTLSTHHTHHTHTVFQHTTQTTHTTHSTLKDSADEVESLSLRPADPLLPASRLQGARPAALTRPGAVPGGPVVAAHRHPADPEPDVKGANVV